MSTKNKARKRKRVARKWIGLHIKAPLPVIFNKELPRGVMLYRNLATALKARRFFHQIYDVPMKNMRLLQVKELFNKSLEKVK